MEEATVAEASKTLGIRSHVGGQSLRPARIPDSGRGGQQTAEMRHGTAGCEQGDPQS